MNLNLIVFDLPSPHLDDEQAMLEVTMKTVQAIALISAVTIIALAWSGRGATADPIVPPGHYCLMYFKGGTDCSFTSYAQCQATASGLTAECYGPADRGNETGRGSSRYRW